MIQIIGINKINSEFKQLSSNLVITQQQFLDTVSNQTLSLLKQNTPIKTGLLQSSWYEVYRDYKNVAIGVRRDQLDKLRYVVNGTSDTRANDFISPVLQVISDNVDFIMRSYLKRTHPYLNNISSGNISGNIHTTANITGLAGNRKRLYQGKKNISIKKFNQFRGFAKLGKRGRYV